MRSFERQFDETFFIDADGANQRPLRTCASIFISEAIWLPPEGMVAKAAAACGARHFATTRSEDQTGVARL